MPFWFPAASSALLLVLLLLQGLFLLAAAKERSAFVLALATGWFFLCLHLLTDLTMLPQWLDLLPLIASQLAMAVGLVLVLHSCRTLRSRHTSPWPAVAAFTGFCLWIVPSHLFLNTPLLGNLPTVCFLASLQLLTAHTLYQSSKTGNLNTMPASGTMALWGIYTITSPFIAPQPPTAATFLAEAVLMLLTGLGLLPILFTLWVRRNHAFGERCQALFTHGQDAMFVFHLNSHRIPDRLLEVNDAACQLLGYPRQELLRCTLRRISAPGLTHGRQPLLESLLAGNSSRFPWLLLDKNRGTIPVEVSAHVFTLDGELTLMASARDVSERQQAREELEQSQHRLLRVLDSLDSLVYVAEMDSGEILYANQAVLREFGDAMGKRCWQVFHSGQQSPSPLCPDHTLLTPAGTPTEPHVREARNPTSGRWYHITSKAIQWQDGRMVRLEIATDITDRVEAERGRERELAVRTAMSMVSEELLTEPLSLTAVANIILPQARKLTGSEHGFIGLIDQKDNSLTVPVYTGMMAHPTDGQVRFPAAIDGRHRGLWGHTLDTGQPFFTNTPDTHQATQGLPKGHEGIHNFLAVPLRLGNAVAGQIALANSETGYSEWDLSAVERLGQLMNLALQRHQVQLERERLLTELRQSQKMEAIGTLAGGIAHDFNNILTGILGYAELTQLDLPLESRSAANVQQIIGGCKRATELIGQIQAFSRTLGEEKRPVALQFVLKESLKLLRATIPSTVEIREEINTNSPSILADITALHQIVVNLCTNAYHAMMPTGGLLSVSLSETEVSFANAHAYPTLTTGAYVKLSVQDTGCGMDERTIEQIFAPSFTTKGQSVGSGLGLATVRHLVSELGGAISVESEPGMGSTFEVLFPAIPASPINDEQESAPSPLPRFNANVLLVDDELSITTLGRSILERMGCTVRTFTSSVAALECFTASPDAYDLVITDQAMPELSGYDLAKRMLAIRPSLQVILATGYSEIISAEQAHQAGIREYLLKPLSVEKLGQTIGRLLPNTGG